MTSYYSLLRPHVVRELRSAAVARRQHDAALAWHHLERAHILSQPSARHHTRVHWAMLATALWVMDAREMFGQVVRILVAGIGSVLGRYPLGNSGRARAPISQPMPIPPDLQATLDEVELAHAQVMRAPSRRASGATPGRDLL